MSSENVEDLTEYLKDDRYPLQRYEVRWNNGHVEFIEATNVVVPYKTMAFGDDESMIRFLKHQEGNKPTILLLAVDSRLVASIRNLTEMENGVQE